jgi:cell division protein FtsZ
MAYEYLETPTSGSDVEDAKIKVIGVGGGGGNALNCIAEAGITGNVEYIAVNTDAQALRNSKAPGKIQIGVKCTGGLGAGAKPEVGENAAHENEDEIREAIKDADMVFITAGMGGGTGTGAAPVVAKIAHDENKLTIGVVTKPFGFEGAKKMEKAEKGIAAMLQNVDALIVIPNQNLLTISAARGQKLTMRQSYQQADEVLKTDVIAIAEIITKHDDINVDFADITTIIKNAGYAHMAIGCGQGKDKVSEVVKQVIESELLGTSVKGAKRLLVDITMSEDIGVDEMAELTDAITNEVDSDAEIIFGNGYDSNLSDAVSVTVIAADFDGAGNGTAEAAPAATASPISGADPKADAEAMHKAGVKAADNPSYYDDIFNVLKRN